MTRLLSRIARAAVRCHAAAASCGALAAAGLAAIGLAVALGAQKPVAAAAGPSSGTTATSNGVTLATIAHAVRNQDMTAVQLRRFRDERGQVVTVREQLAVDADGTDAPNFSLQFVGVEGEPASSPLSQKWQHNYSRYGGLFFRSGQFRIRDLQLAQQNYSVHDFGVVTRAQRVAHRVVVFPNRLDKSVWVLDIDAVTQVPLYTAEFDAQFRLLAEVEAQTFADTAQVTTPYSPAQVVTRYASFAAAAAAIQSAVPGGDAAPAVIEPTNVAAAEYTLGRVEVSVDPLNGRRSLLLGYTDGIDEFFVAQTPNAPDQFQGLPSQQPAAGQSAAHTIARYRDPSLSVLMFWDAGTAFQVAGRGGLQRLDRIARDLYAQSLRSH